MNRFRRTKKRLIGRSRRLRTRLAVQLLALRHHRIFGEPRLLDLVAAGRAPTLSYPHFLIIGAPKCGTSWLQGALARHPHVIVVPDEIEYFSSHIHKYPLEWYIDRFTREIRAVAAEKTTPWIVGEKSARYCSLSPSRIELVHRLLPEVRLILMTRDPVARHWSHVKQYYSKRRVAEREGGDVLSLPRERLFRFLARTRFLGEFSKMIANWTAVYPTERLLIVSQEHAFANPRATFDAVLAHLGVTRDSGGPSTRKLSKQRNAGPSIRMPDDVAAFLQEMFAGERKRLQALLSGRGIVNAADLAGVASGAPATAVQPGA